MRDQRYVAVHRGGSLSLEHHRLLAAWAADCAEHVLPLFTARQPSDQRPAQAIATARAWASGEIGVAEVRAASVASHAAAREAPDEVARQVARACGHAVATGHMADHAPGGAVYAIKALRALHGKASEEVVPEEHAWQKAHLPEPIRELVLSTFRDKFAMMNL